MYMRASARPSSAFAQWRRRANKLDQRPADGTILGEGLGVLVLKRLDRRAAQGWRQGLRGDPRGWGPRATARGSGSTPRSRGGAGQGVAAGLRVGGVSPADGPELVEAHGTGTKVGDTTELAALAEVYREAQREGSWCALGSVSHRSDIRRRRREQRRGFDQGGTGRASSQLVLPPTIWKVTRPTEGAEPGRLAVLRQHRALPTLAAAAAIIPAASRGQAPRLRRRSNFHCVLEEAEPALPGIDWDGDVQIVALSADRPDILLAALDGWPRDLAWEAFRGEASRSRARFRAGDVCRLLLVVERETTDLGRIVAKAAALVAAGHSSAPEGIFVGSGPAAGALAMLFPGQGSQYVGMLRDLACRFPMLHASRTGGGEQSPPRSIDEAAPLGDLIYPHPAYQGAIDARARPGEQRCGPPRSLQQLRSPGCKAQAWGSSASSTTLASRPAGGWRPQLRWS